MSRCTTNLMVALWLLSVGPLDAAAQARLDLPHQRWLVEARCGQCHLLDVPPEGMVVQAEAPPFAEIAGRASTTPLSLRAFLLTPHINMPNLILDQDEIESVVAYILSLRAARP